MTALVRGWERVGTYFTRELQLKRRGEHTSRQALGSMRSTHIQRTYGGGGVRKKVGG